MSNLELMSMAVHKPDDFEEIRLSKEQRLLYLSFVDAKDFTVTEAAEAFESSKNNMHQRILKLHAKGYLTRAKVDLPTGGIYYQYNVVKL